MRTKLFILVIALTVTLNNCSEESGFLNTVGRLLTIKSPFSSGDSRLQKRSIKALNITRTEGCDCKEDGVDFFQHDKTKKDLTCDADGKCHCKCDVCGDKCDECCEGHKSYPKCEGCMCKMEGSKSSICDKKTGQCVCKDDLIDGLYCQKCKDGYFKYPECEDCKCKPEGSNSVNCDNKTGVCTDCKKNVVGPKCNECEENYYKWPECSACECKEDGSVDGRCDDNGKCSCNPNVCGDKCDKCCPGYDNYPACDKCANEYHSYPHCKKCTCKKYAKDNECNVDTGKCTCIENACGDECDEPCDEFCPNPDPNCVADPKDGEKCPKPILNCKCNKDGSKTLVCDKKTGECTCNKNVTGPKCDQCKKGHSNFPKGCPACECKEDGSVDENCDINGKCSCNPNVCGDKCDKCCPGYNNYPACDECAVEWWGYPTCKKCKCNMDYSKSNECDATTGKCNEVCKDNMTGPDCATPEEGYCLGKEKGVTNECNCNLEGSKDKTCTQKECKCDCKENVQGEKCTECKPGHSNFPKCDDCGCDPKGSVSENCDDEGTCSCKKNVCGPKCNKCCTGYDNFPKCDKCAVEWWGYNITTQDGCKKCTCDPDYSLSNECDPVTGQCPCKPNMKGKDCTEPDDGWFCPTPGETKECECKEEGVGYMKDDPTKKDLSCGLMTGICKCKEFVVGDKCDECKQEHYEFPECKACTCNPDGSKDNKCNVEDGQCYCNNHNIIGKNCDKCAENYWNFPKCEACMCHKEASKSQKCDDKTGQCPCRANVQGLRCTECKPGYYGFPDCKDCKCDPVASLGITCGKDNGKCDCKPTATGDKCEFCKPGYWKHPECIDCDCDMEGSEDNNCDKDNGVCICKKRKDGKVVIEGDKCDKCRDGYFNFPKCEDCNCNVFGMVDVSCDKTGKCVCKPNYTGLKCNECEPGHYNIKDECHDCKCFVKGSETSSCDETGKCTCKENYEGPKCDKCKDGFHKPEEGCVPCECNTEGSENNKCDENGKCNCKCNVIGDKCDDCSAEFWNFPTCEECACNSHGSIAQHNDNHFFCESEGGQCKCKAGYGGRACDECEAGKFGFPNCKACTCHAKGSKSDKCDSAGKCECVSETVEGNNCDKCKMYHYNFPECLPCECNAEGSKTESCHETTGKCTCKGENIAGEKCDKCATGYSMGGFPKCAKEYRFKIKVSNAVDPSGKGLKDVTIKTKCKSTGDVKVFKTDESGHAICGPFTEGQDLEWECPAPEGFSDAKGEILVKSGIASKKMVIALNPKLKDGENARLVLSWGSKPSDLDSMVDVYDETGKFVKTLSWAKKTLQSTRGGGTKTWMTLDVDETEGGDNGPETITVKHIPAGYKFKYYIYDYSKKVGRDGMSWHNSDAKVTIYGPEGKGSIEMMLDDTKKVGEETFYFIGCFDDTYFDGFKKIAKTSKTNNVVCP